MRLLLLWFFLWPLDSSSVFVMDSLSVSAVFHCNGVAKVSSVKHVVWPGQVTCALSQSVSVWLIFAALYFFVFFPAGKSISLLRICVFSMWLLLFCLFFMPILSIELFCDRLWCRRSVCCPLKHWIAKATTVKHVIWLDQVTWDWLNRILFGQSSFLFCFGPISCRSFQKLGTRTMSLMTALLIRFNLLLPHMQYDKICCYPLEIVWVNAVLICRRLPGSFWVASSFSSLI